MRAVGVAIEDGQLERDAHTQAQREGEGSRQVTRAPETTQRPETDRNHAVRINALHRER